MNTDKPQTETNTVLGAVNHDESTITVKELIEQLCKYDGNKPVNISAVGMNSTDSWNAPLQFAELTVDEFNGIVRINFSLYG